MGDRLGFRDAVRILSERPGRAWPDGVLHHGARVVLLVAVALVVHLFYPVTPVRDMPVPERGTISDRDVIAEFSFNIHKSEAELASERAEAAATVSPIFDFDAAAADTMLARIGEFMSRADTAAAIGGQEGEEAIRDLLRSYGFAVTTDAVALLQDATQRQNLRRALELAVAGILPAGVAHRAELDESRALQVRIRTGDTERIMPRDSVVTATSFYDRAAAYLQSPRPEAAELQRWILIRFFQPTLRLNRDATEMARANARLAVPEIKGEVLAGERIVASHQRMGDLEVERLRAYRDALIERGELEPQASTLRVIGACVVNVLALSIFGLLLFFYREPVYRNLRHVVLLAGLIVAVTGAGAILVQAGWPLELVPIVFPALVVATLWDGRMALHMSLVTAILLAAQAPFSNYASLFPMVIGGAAASLSVRVVRRRAQTWVFIAFIAGAYAAGEFSLGLLRSREFGEILGSISWTTINAVASAFLAMGFLPVFEAFTRITTDQTLLELSDLNRPLLKRLALEAPGTYAHSITVANLAEAAADAIGAHSLLTRVGIYYHDVGKMVKPQFYVENQNQGRNPHDRLKPATSAAIVRGHVIEGLRLADEAKLPHCVKAFIAEHHGTQPISFFYTRALEEEPEGTVDPAEYCYPGPRPQSKETAIAMLADSVESAARALADPTPEKIRELVSRIVDSKIQMGQLDDAPLTLGEIAIIKDKLSSVLAGIHHQRIDYPAPREIPTPAPAELRTAASG
ncbi:MAG TPA: HDIG domain-containing protein [Longimicrobiales bacterium]|nr:HDIG domain-containing protein [Longimicrobiales bacterium]